MRFRAINAFYMDSEANNCKGKIAKSGLAQSNVCINIRIKDGSLHAVVVVL